MRKLDASAPIRRTSRFQNLNREPTRLPISTVVLGSQRMPVNEAIYSVKDVSEGEHRAIR
jgi:hypothetical protein